MLLLVLIARGEMFWSFCSPFGLLIIFFAQYVDILYVYVSLDG